MVFSVYYDYWIQITMQHTSIEEWKPIWVEVNSYVPKHLPISFYIVREMKIIGNLNKKLYSLPKQNFKVKIFNMARLAHEWKMKTKCTITIPRKSWLGTINVKSSVKFEGKMHYSAQNSIRVKKRLNSHSLSLVERDTIWIYFRSVYVICTCYAIFMLLSRAW